MERGQKLGKEPQLELKLPEEVAAVRRCVLTCLTNRWVPTLEEVTSLVRLKDEYLSGQRDEFKLSDNEWNRLRFAKHLYKTGRLQS